uniref:Rab-GAP TBC domain-containing protein n=1 Tax=Pyrodinium bahamense TaxID=73915 RepID=A0A7S0B834_9DINO
MAATRIQTHWRRLAASRRAPRRNSDRARAAALIQAGWRAATCARAYRAVRRSVVLVQALARARHARRHTQLLRRRLRAAVRLQSMVRAGLSRRRVAKLRAACCQHGGAAQEIWNGSCKQKVGGPQEDRTDLIVVQRGADALDLQPEANPSDIGEEPPPTLAPPDLALTSSQSIPHGQHLRQGQSPVCSPERVQRSSSSSSPGSPMSPEPNPEPSPEPLPASQPDPAVASCLRVAVPCLPHGAPQEAFVPESIEAMLAAAAEKADLPPLNAALPSSASFSSSGSSVPPPPELHQQRRLSGARLCTNRCWWLGLAGRAPPPHPVAMRLAARMRRQAPRRSQYQGLVAEAVAVLHESVIAKIKADAPRTFHVLPHCRPTWGWPDTAEPSTPTGHPMEACLIRMLLAYEWRATKMAATRDAGAASGLEAFTYVTGVNLLGAMCLGFVRGREEEAFWLLAYVLEELLGPGYLSQAPPLLGLQGDRAAAAALLAEEAPHAARALGPHNLPKVLALLAPRCLLGGFVGCLADEPLLALWEELLEPRFAFFPRLPLLEWLVGLVRAAEPELVDLPRGRPAGEVAAAAFQRVMNLGRSLSSSARLGRAISEDRARELKQLAEEPFLPFTNAK